MSKRHPSATDRRVPRGALYVVVQEGPEHGPVNRTPDRVLRTHLRTREAEDAVAAPREQIAPIPRDVADGTRPRARAAAGAKLRIGPEGTPVNVPGE